MHSTPAQSPITMDLEPTILTILAKMGAISRVVGLDQMQTELKEDRSLVTNIDLAVSDYLVQRLEELTGYPVISEEIIKEFPYERRQGLDKFWLVDPLDGTKGYAAGGTDYCHMLSFIDYGESVFAAVYLPRQDQGYLIGGKGMGVYRGKLAYTMRYQGEVISEEQLAELVKLDLDAAFTIELELAPRQAQRITAADYVDFHGLEVEHPEQVTLARVESEIAHFKRESLASLRRILTERQGYDLHSSQAYTLSRVPANYQRLALNNPFTLTSKQLVVKTGYVASGIRLAGRLKITALQEHNCEFEYKNSAGVKIYEVLTSKNASYFASGVMSEWDLAPLSCFMHELGGHILDVASLQYCAADMFNRQPTTIVGPVFIFMHENLLPFFCNLQELLALHPNMVKVTQKRLHQSDPAKDCLFGWAEKLGIGKGK